jgi:hypothetical protein
MNGTIDRGHGCTADPVEDIGHGVTIEKRYIDGEINGVYYEHPCVGGAMSPGYVPVDRVPSQLSWTLVQLDPLTLSPSLLCRVCGHHGFIREGRWVPA